MMALGVFAIIITVLCTTSAGRVWSVKVLSVGLPPFIFQNKAGEFDGIDVQILKLITKKLKVDLSIKEIDTTAGISDAYLK